MGEKQIIRTASNVRLALLFENIKEHFPMKGQN